MQSAPEERFVEGLLVRILQSLVHAVLVDVASKSVFHSAVGIQGHPIDWECSAEWEEVPEDSRSCP
jgi:hypothetical protein